MRQIVIDTETTGLSARNGDRVVEIGAIEIVNHLPTGRQYQVYLNPERDMPPEAERVHGLSIAFLADKPLFAAVCDELLTFIGEAPLVAHNAGFDVGFLNAELARAGRAVLSTERVIDTVEIARRKFPGAQASLDALCRRFQIDTTHRTKHGALLDAELLARVYLELVGGREPGLLLNAVAGPAATHSQRDQPIIVARPARPHAPSAAETAAHAEFLKRLKDPIWVRDAPDGAGSSN